MAYWLQWSLPEGACRRPYILPEMCLLAPQGSYDEYLAKQEACEGSLHFLFENIYRMRNWGFVSQGQAGDRLHHWDKMFS